MNNQNQLIRFGKASFSMITAVIVFFIKILDSMTDSLDDSSSKDAHWSTRKEVFRTDRYTNKEYMFRRPYNSK